MSLIVLNAERYQFPHKFDPVHWEKARQALNTTHVKSTDDLAKLFGQVGRATSNRSSACSSDTKDYVNLFTAISELESDEKENFNFWERLLPQLQRDVIAAPEILGEDCPALFQERGECDVQLTHQQAYIIACLAFFGLCHPFYEQYRSRGDFAIMSKAHDRFGHLNWSQVYGRRGGRIGEVAIARIKCQLSYLNTISSLKNPENDTYITFHRTVLTSQQQPSWRNSTNIQLSNVRVHISTDDKIEDIENADAHLDFANKYLHIGEIAPSATQEEVLFSVRPECFVGLLFSEMMHDNEAIIITGARRFSNYTGYLSTFRYAGVYNNSVNNNNNNNEDIIEQQQQQSPPPAIIAIDSLVNNGNQFNNNRIERDINKAYLGFTGLSSRKASTRTNTTTFQSISTGQWGCGVFMGDPIFKFIQQILAATQAGVTDLYFSAFHEPDLAKELSVILDGLYRCNVSVAELYNFLMDFETRNNNTYSNESNVKRFHRELKELVGITKSTKK